MNGEQGKTKGRGTQGEWEIIRSDTNGVDHTYPDGIVFGGQRLTARFLTEAQAETLLDRVRRALNPTGIHHLEFFARKIQP